MDKHYNYGVIEGNTITLFNDSTITRSLLYSDFLKDVSVEISDTGILYISANKLEYDLYMCGSRIFEDEWKRTPDPKLIKEGKRYIWSRNKEKYVNGGWVRTTERTPIKYVFNNYKIEILK